MPLFLDIHHNEQDVSRAAVEKAHLSDLEAQARHQVRYLKYWFDQTSGTICCLIEAPSAEAWHAVHRDATIAVRTTRVKGVQVDAFPFGRGQTVKHRHQNIVVVGDTGSHPWIRESGQRVDESHAPLASQWAIRQTTAGR